MSLQPASAKRQAQASPIPELAPEHGIQVKRDEAGCDDDMAQL